MIESQLAKVKYALTVVKNEGIKKFFFEVKRRIYRTKISVGLEKNLDIPDSEVKCKVNYTLGLATPEYFEGLVQLAKRESKSEMSEMIERKTFYDLGFHNCYVARTTDTNEPCYMQWTISRQDENAGSPVFRSNFHFSRLKKTDLQLEDAYTFVKYRGNKIMPSVMVQLFSIARDKGFKRVITYVESDNIASLKGCYTAGFQEFERIHKTVFLLSSRRKVLPANRPEDSASPIQHMKPACAPKEVCNPQLPGVKPHK